MSSAVGIRELKANLSRYLKQVGGGRTLLVTDHGRAVALITPLDDAARDEWVREFVREGGAVWSGGKPAGSPRLARLRGPLTVSDAVIEDRE